MRDAAVPMTPPSILFTRPEERAAAEACAPPDCFSDLNLDQLIDAVTSAWSQYDLKSFFYFHLRRLDDVAYRQEVFRDLQTDALLAQVREFAARMQAMRDHLAQAGKLYYQQQKEAWFLDAVDVYCEAVTRLAKGLADASLSSRGLAAIRDYLSNYAASPAFLSLAGQTRALKRDLASLEYWVLLEADRFQVSKPGAAVDYTEDVVDTFERFRQGATKSYFAKFVDSANMNHIEAKVLEFVAGLYPGVFARLRDYCMSRGAYLDEVIGAFDREVHFYVAVLSHIAKLRASGLPFCYPRVLDNRKDIKADDAFDIVLAGKLVEAGSHVVCNDFHLSGAERVIVVTGPNQGGKTTFARMFGQLHYLASLGCPVPGREAQLFGFDMLFTHFEREEQAESLRGKLQDDLLRVHDIVARATPRSIVILNEIFTSTALQDAIFLSRQIMSTLAGQDLLAVWVTFVDELASYGPQTVSMASSVTGGGSTSRAFKILRKPADGLSHAMSIAARHGVTYQRLKERLGS